MPKNVPVALLYNLDPRWTLAEQSEVTETTSLLADAIAAVGHPTTLAPVKSDDIDAALGAFDPLEHVVFNWCESVPGIPQSEPAAARTLESLGFAFTGSSSRTLALAANKQRVRLMLERAGITGPHWRICDKPAAHGWCWFPAIVKSAHDHSSIGITRDSVVMTPGELRARIAFMLETCRKPVLVEEFIDGREFHIALWGNDPVVALPPVEMDYSTFTDVRDRLCTFDAKFVPDSVHFQGLEAVLPVKLPACKLRALERVSKTAYKVVGCRDYARVDVRLRNGVCHVLDVNPNADISAHASVARAANHAGHSYGETGSRIVHMAATRHPVWGAEEK